MIVGLAVLLVVLVAFVYYFPLQRIMAERKFEQYIALQGVKEGDIESKRVYKDYTKDGYYITVTYHSDPEHYYDYQYFLIRNLKSGIRLDTMYCTVFDLMNRQISLDSDAVYRPLNKPL